MNDDLRDNRRVELVERLTATRDLLADALGDGVPGPTHITLARRVSADCVEMYLATAGEITGVPFLRSVVVAKSKLRGRDVERQAGLFLEQCLTVAGLATQAAAQWSSPEIPADRRRYLFCGLVVLHCSMTQTIAIMFEDPAVETAAEALEAEAKALADEIGPAVEDAA